MSLEPDVKSAQRVVDMALDSGVNFFDTADLYDKGENEKILGKILKDKRKEVIIATKVGNQWNPDGNSWSWNPRKEYILSAVEESLKRLQTDHIDLYQLHRPAFDIPMDETLGALTDLVRQGKVRYIGSSTAPAWKVMEALMVSELKGLVRFVSEQPPYNLLDRRIENELVPMCQAHGLAILPWTPLAMGVLAGRYSDAAAFPADSRASLRGGIYAQRVTARGIEIGKQFVQLANERGMSPAQLAVLWVKDQPGITAPLIGPRTVEQLEHFLPVLEMQLDESIRLACDELVPPGSVVANFHNSAPWMKMRVDWPE